MLGEANAHLECLQLRITDIMTGNMPGISLTEFEVNQDGLVNDVIIVNKSWVFRFAKSDEGAEILDKETKILDLVRSRVGVTVPDPVYQSRDCIVYPFLEGQPLLRETLLGGDETTQNNLAEQLGRFLYKLHTTPLVTDKWRVPNTQAPVTRDIWVDRRERIREKIYPLLLPHQIQWAENLLNGMLDDPAAFTFEPALIHGDLAPYHILFDPNERRISGVIDFGVAGVGDAALDIGNLITSYGETFVRKMQPVYPDLEKHLRKARFHAQSIELEWVLLGLETGENFWFTAHLGGARDIL